MCLSDSVAALLSFPSGHLSVFLSLWLTDLDVFLSVLSLSLPSVSLSALGLDPVSPSVSVWPNSETLTVTCSLKCWTTLRCEGSNLFVEVKLLCTYCQVVSLTFDPVFVKPESRSSKRFAPFRGKCQGWKRGLNPNKRTRRKWFRDRKGFTRRIDGRIEDVKLSYEESQEHPSLFLLPVRRGKRTGMADVERFRWKAQQSRWLWEETKECAGNRAWSHEVWMKSGSGCPPCLRTKLGRRSRERGEVRRRGRGRGQGRDWQRTRPLGGGVS